MREKMKGKLDLEDEGDTQKPVIVLTSSEDEEANEDLSLKIVEKARMREMNRKRKEDFDEFEVSEGVRSAMVIDLSSSSCEVTEAADQCGATDSGDMASVVAVLEVKNMKKKTKKKKDIKSEERNVNIGRTEDHADTAEAVETVSLVETEAETVKSVEVGAVKSMGAEGVEVSDNIVLRKLLRGPRYFDPLGSSWDKCYNCGKEGHAAVNCVSQERKKPCFVCGSLEHSVKHCTEGQYCYICKRKGHRKKDCPEKDQKKSSESSNTCLKCGDAGHDMFSCWSDYSPDDLKEIQCYSCKAFGHFCCTDFIDTGPRVVSCYNCGQFGHTGLGCAKSRGGTIGAGSSTVCYKCGEEGHLARGCTKYSQSAQRIGGFSTPRKRSHKEGRDAIEFRSAPHNRGRGFKKKRMQHEEIEIATPAKSKRRGGWITDDPGDLPNIKSKANGWRSPTTPSKKGHRISNLTRGGDTSSSRSPWKSPNLPPRTPGSRGSANSYQPRFSASRFGNSSASQFRRNYDW
ncbi:protein AIR1-like [Macadamia integrifolia]|uniref:protein AIR1-like n=1 Tax=Macadamia integrifolia TaxID=60698 RepID=UPI001C4FFFDA|nr:protein AIR1-like [Macadamia integrifolia]XP_042499220.1 protein AIR1-like [Macadamia integrifolia]